MLYLRCVSLALAERLGPPAAGAKAKGLRVQLQPGKCEEREKHPFAFYKKERPKPVYTQLVIFIKLLV